MSMGNNDPQSSGQAGPELITQRAAVIDIGSNSIKILVAETDDNKQLFPVFENTIETRISKGISGQPPMLLPESMASGVATVVRLWTSGLNYRPAHWAIVATSAVRSAINGEDFMAAIATGTGIHPEILSGDEEAEGIAAGVRTDPEVSAVFPDCTIFDLGGGSLEFIRVQDCRVHNRISLPLGAVRMTERFVRNPLLPVKESTQLDILEFVRDQILAADFPLSSNLIGCSGGLSILRRRIAIDSAKPFEEISPLLFRDYIDGLCKRICKQTFEERIHLSRIPEARADIFPAALLTYQAILHLAKTDRIVHSLHNLRYGIAARLLKLS